MESYRRSRKRVGHIKEENESSQPKTIRLFSQSNKNTAQKHIRRKTNEKESLKITLLECVVKIIEREEYAKQLPFDFNETSSEKELLDELLFVYNSVIKDKNKTINHLKEDNMKLHSKITDFEEITVQMGKEIELLTSQMRQKNEALNSSAANGMVTKETLKQELLSVGKTLENVLNERNEMESTFLLQIESHKNEKYVIENELNYAKNEYERKFNEYESEIARNEKIITHMNNKIINYAQTQQQKQVMYAPKLQTFDCENIHKNTKKRKKDFSSIAQLRKYKTMIDKQKKDIQKLNKIIEDLNKNIKGLQQKKSRNLKKDLRISQKIMKSEKQLHTMNDNLHAQILKYDTLFQHFKNKQNLIHDLNKKLVMKNEQLQKQRQINKENRKSVQQNITSVGKQAKIEKTEIVERASVYSTLNEKYRRYQNGDQRSIKHLLIKTNENIRLKNKNNEQTRIILDLRENSKMNKNVNHSLQLKVHELNSVQIKMNEFESFKYDIQRLLIECPSILPGICNLNEKQNYSHQVLVHWLSKYMKDCNTVVKELNEGQYKLSQMQTLFATEKILRGKQIKKIEKLYDRNDRLNVSVKEMEEDIQCIQNENVCLKIRLKKNSEMETKNIRSQITVDQMIAKFSEFKNVYYENIEKMREQITSLYQWKKLSCKQLNAWKSISNVHRSIAEDRNKSDFTVKEQQNNTLKLCEEIDEFTNMMEETLQLMEKEIIFDIETVLGLMMEL